MIAQFWLQKQNFPLRSSKISPFPLDSSTLRAQYLAKPFERPWFDHRFRPKFRYSNRKSSDLRLIYEPHRLRHPCNWTRMHWLRIKSVCSGRMRGHSLGNGPIRRRNRNLSGWTFLKLKDYVSRKTRAKMGHKQKMVCSWALKTRNASFWAVWNKIERF